MSGDGTASLEAERPDRTVDRTPGRQRPPVAAPGYSASKTYTDLHDAIGSARDFTAAFLLAEVHRRRGIRPRTVEDARLVVSELVTNVVRHAAGPCRVDLHLTAGTLEIAVSDADEVIPVAHAQDPARVGQHGLEIVLALCRSVHVEPIPSGKRVRARLAVD
ncbi:ATP-binding protein [Streptomyces lavendofoliae]|uniref:ATPase n=1 Tax=Streptomyces lavendofoliae TaxID=67314 RepID=A0A918M655_9ACTN|nr:ATP-binding protein [Streptomyces lavendofoliae]GGU47844.1 ATPase [Streptomyces lavendofoliae]